MTLWNFQDYILPQALLARISHRFLLNVYKSLD